MPRKPRYEEPAAAHHAFPRGNGGRDIFRDDADRQVLLVILIGVVEAYGWRLFAYCLMRNHFHLVVQTQLPNFGDGMHRLLSIYARYFNRRYGRTGHVFRRPFKSERIKNELQFAVAVDYVVHNPVKAGLCDAAREWRWSSHGSGADVHRAVLMSLPRAGSRISVLSQTGA